MNWIANFVRPRIKSLIGGRGNNTPENLWRKCPSCGEMIFHRDLEIAQNVCPKCQHHLRIGAAQRFGTVFDSGSYEELLLPAVMQDPLRFRDERRYADRLKDARNKTGRQEAIAAARGTLDGIPVIIAVQPFDFLGGSLGMGVGEGLVQAMQTAVQDRQPFILFVASGGARMQEGILSLMQMPRATIAVDLLHEAGLPYIVVLTDPTTGGVSASYAMLGDVHIAEPGALIGFTGQRVIEQTIRERLPDGFQRAEYLSDHGMVDMVVHRHRMRETLSRLVRLLTQKDAAGVAAPNAPVRSGVQDVAQQPAGSSA
ncbi:MAG TPA: acetyl-CoA carboxylase, carboxyltransferase subunit beta [Rhizomicrobium sp.]|jgi:acetyl-CoA carboxylase carboxyl transferase subunit beta|nr:acetyl-CoA carboxylase, carboxyltransferase subunit beta [Rhizomicrobium sp.]